MKLKFRAYAYVLLQFPADTFVQLPTDNSFGAGLTAGGTSFDVRPTAVGAPEDPPTAGDATAVLFGP